MLRYSLIVLLFQNSLSAPLTALSHDPTSNADGSNSTASAWRTAPNVRSTYDLISACFVTLTICAWSAYHPNIPIKSSWWSLFGRRVKWVLVAIFAPELVIVLASTQLHGAWELMKEVNATIKARKSHKMQLETLSHGCCAACKHNASSFVEMRPSIVASSTWPKTKTSRCTVKVQNSECVELASEKGEECSNDETWSIYQALFVLSGGIAVESDSFHPWERITFEPRGILVLARLGILPRISKEDIEDKSKADSFAKAILCLQAGWFFIQSVARLSEGLPLTLLEIHTNTNIFCAFLLYFLWLKKPYDVGRPFFSADPRVIDVAALLAAQPALIDGDDGRKQNYRCCTRMNNLTLEHIESAHERPAYDTISWEYFRGMLGESMVTLMYGDDSNAFWLPTWRDVNHERATEHLKRANRAIEFMREKNFHFMWQERTPVEGLELVSGRVMKSSIEYDNSYVCFRAGAIPEGMLDQSDLVAQNIVSNPNPSGNGQIESPNLNRRGVKESLEPNEATPTGSHDDSDLAFPKWYSIVEQYSLRKWMFMIVCAAYGGAHLSAWNSHFPTAVEMWIWRAGCITLCSGPFLAGSLYTMSILDKKISNRRASEKDYKGAGRLSRLWTCILWLERIPYMFLVLTTSVVVVVYIPARFYIIVEALISLRSPASGTYRTVNWTTYIPHAN